jgi:hypothetical protein
MAEMRKEDEMKVLWVALAFGLCVSAFAPQATAGNCDGMVGVWEYKEPARGRVIVAKAAEKYTFVYFRLQEPREGSPDAAQTDAWKVAAYDELSGGAAEYSCAGSGSTLELTGRTLYSAKPADPGPTWRGELQVEGNDARWWFLKSDGSRGPVNEASRVE